MTVEEEQPLFGGLASARVVRIGDSVRRPAGPWTATVHALLAHLRAGDFPCPRPLGLDAQGRESVSFIPGRPGNWPWPPALLELAGVRQIATLLRNYHAAVANFSPPIPAIWRQGPSGLADGEVVLHGDFGPYNLIWRGAELIGVIDWDLARPGRPIEDASFAALKCAPLSPDPAFAALGFATPPDRRRRLEAFAEAYGVFSSGELIAAGVEAQNAEIERMERLGPQGVEPWADWIKRGLLERVRSEIVWLQAWARTENLA